MKDPISKELIFNYFSGNATALEKDLIDRWTTDSQAREQLFIWLVEWENQNIQYNANVDLAINRHFTRMDEQPAKTWDEPAAAQPMRRLHVQGKSWLIAAAVTLLVLAGGWLTRDHLRYEIYTTGFGQIERLTLPDGSKVVLNANSTLRVPRFGFGKTTRDVYMTGEADFAITHTANHQKFIVHTEKNFEVEVLGTEFNVYARPRRSRVVLNKGKVKLHYLKGSESDQIVMRPGDLVTFDAPGHASVRKTTNPANYSAWKAHRFVFENESLREICDLFEDNFGLKIQIPDSTLAAQTVSGSFTALNAEELFEILADDSGLSYSRSEDGKVITLDY
ncbi:FecR family protein [Dyadobacter jiangsuensis]|uniref:FecR family protein n=1 Tax=Dyadobacter jiangsuensis TaxID=1591085 RepID=A0A2P8FZP3_9BACT|nr:FecR domain-containing protein [Dyadobacter jiangsuensis]PSL27184.1 FecR family protein [Dyadobacter jiangsuensis]